MKTPVAFALGVLTGLAFARIPHYVGPLFQDEPETPPGHRPRERYWNGGVEVTKPDTGWPLGYHTGRPNVDHVFKEITLP